MTLQILISAMHLSDFSIVEKSNEQTDVLKFKSSHLQKYRRKNYINLYDRLYIR